MTGDRMVAIEQGLLCVSEGSERFDAAARNAILRGDSEFAARLETAARQLIELHNELTRAVLSPEPEISQLRLAG